MKLPGITNIALDYEIFGVKIQQNNYALSLINFLFQIKDPSLIIEFGARTGGLSIFLSLYGFNKNIEFLTFECEENSLMYAKIIKSFGGHIFYKNIFSEEVISLVKDKMQKSTRTIIFCDAVKIKEFNLYSDFMKSGDIILAHDYAHDAEDFENIRKENIWHHQEICFSDIQEACERNGLEYFDRDLFRSSAWGVFIKK